MQDRGRDWAWEAGEDREEICARCHITPVTPYDETHEYCLSCMEEVIENRQYRGRIPQEVLDGLYPSLAEDE